MGLNRLSKIVLKFNEESTKNIPASKEVLDIILNELLEILDSLIYEDRKENNNRYPLYGKNVKVDSIIATAQRLSKYKLPKDKKKYFEDICGILVNLESMEYSIKKIKKGIHKLLKDLDKK